MRVMRAMPIRSPLPTDTRSKLSDWIEVNCLTSQRRTASRAELLGLFDLLSDTEAHELERDAVTGESLESEILEDQRASLADDVLDELQYRAETLQGAYPFLVQIRRQQWRLLRKETDNIPEEEHIAQECYVFCLLTSAIRDHSIQGAGSPPLTRAMAIHFQAIAAEAAADVVGGESISFGFPRPAGDGFRPALNTVSQRMSLGRPLDAIPLWSNGAEKDAGIDVIAWREFCDFRPGKLVLLGQVASGHNWTAKSVKSDTPRFLSWFSERPMEHFIPAIFIPFPQHHFCLGRGDAAFETVARAQAWLREQEFGLVVDRLRIVGAAARQMLRRPAEELPEMMDGVSGWIVDTLGVARSAA